MALYVSNPGGRALPTDFTSAVTSALVVAFAPDRDGPASSGETASSDSVVAPCFVIS